MATKTVTLKDSNGDTLYPVTDSNVVNINQQKTLAQALDGVVYAEDPTQNATPTAWVTGSDVNWTTTAQSYSTAEVDTGATWIDGKHIYKKTIDFGALPNNTSKHVPHGISNLARIVKVEQSITNGSQNSHGFVFISSNSSGSLFNFYGTNTSVAIATTDNRSDSNAIITLWYTKTTD